MPINADDKPQWKKRIDHGNPWYQCYWHDWKMTVSPVNSEGLYEWKVYRGGNVFSRGASTANIVMNVEDQETGMAEAEAFVRLNSDLFDGRKW